MMTLLVSEKTMEELADPMKGYIHRPIYFALRTTVDKVNEKYAGRKPEHRNTFGELYESIQKNLGKGANYPLGNNFEVILRQLGKDMYSVEFGDICWINFNLNDRRGCITETKLHSDKIYRFSFDDAIFDSMDELEDVFGFELGVCICGIIGDFMGTVKEVSV